MKTLNILLLNAALLTHLTLRAQPKPAEPLFDLRPILVPGTTIDGQLIDDSSSLGDAAINDKGDVAFTIWSSSGRSIFTTKRLVATEYEEADGKFISFIPAYTPIAINTEGQVAFLAWYANSREQLDGPGNALGIFVDHRLATNIEPGGAYPSALTLTDDGQVIIGGPAPTLTTSTSPARANPPVAYPLPSGLPPIRMPSTPKLNAPARTEAFPYLRPNSRGQFVIPVNLPNGFVLLVATPHR